MEEPEVSQIQECIFVLSAICWVRRHNPLPISAIRRMHLSQWGIETRLLRRAGCSFACLLQNWGFPTLREICAQDSVQERLSVLAAPREVRSTFLFARLRSAGGVYLSGGLKPATETSRILTYPPLIEVGVFPSEINYL